MEFFGVFLLAMFAALIVYGLVEFITDRNID